MREKSLPL
uniref:Uncharacterized protein n=1 Tax=Rhizophora mucronata TaxID=61149 RepID=A0A2P2NSI2_RHIMU